MKDLARVIAIFGGIAIMVFGLRKFIGPGPYAPKTCAENATIGTSNTCEPGQSIVVENLGAGIVVTCRCPGPADAGAPDGAPQ